MYIIGLSRLSDTAYKNDFWVGWMCSVSAYCQCRLRNL